MVVAVVRRMAAWRGSDSEGGQARVPPAEGRDCEAAEGVQDENIRLGQRHRYGPGLPPYDGRPDQRDRLFGHLKGQPVGALSPVLGPRGHGVAGGQSLEEDGQLGHLACGRPDHEGLPVWVLGIRLQSAEE
eukprot:TRINITY_DN2256_c0_g1_i1.p2 TRINITY_DN2256_c0_g1~~TRINITY_DN2256_c0_g1_i1.p2  ORF type:complete len:131 (+),score=14.84 TRINITY_DN2256_c0_g1_i1:65-457(+)